MRNITVSFPDFVEPTEFDIKMILAGKLYQLAKLTSGQAADLVGISKREFIESMGKYGFSAFSESSEDIRKDVANA
jgi:hypothetical protein